MYPGCAITKKKKILPISLSKTNFTMLNSLLNFKSAENNRIQFSGHLDTKEHCNTTQDYIQIHHLNQIPSPKYSMVAEDEQ